MRKKMIVLFSVMLLTVAMIFAQDIPSGGVANAFKKGSATELSQYLADNVEITLPEQNVSGNRAKAESTLNTFFANNKVSTFTMNHQGQKGESCFAIGTLNTSTGVYRVNCFFKKIQNKYLIHQIRIEKQ